jgi:hypothetical protein
LLAILTTIGVVVSLVIVSDLGYSSANAVVNSSIRHLHTPKQHLTPTITTSTATTTTEKTTNLTSGLPFPPRNIVVETTQRMAAASVNASPPRQTCLPTLDHFIKPIKEKRFIIVKQCVTVTGTVVWTHYFNDDGDANFNVALDTSYKGMLAPGNYDVKYVPHNKPPVAALHLEAVCQGPVLSLTGENVGACNGYNGPNFKPVLPKIGQHVMVTGRYLVEFPEVAGGLAELHPVYAIKIIP